MTTVPIQNTFDITSARNLLRRKIAGAKWLPPFRARAATIVTMMGELILMTQKQGALEVNVIMTKELWGIDIKCKINDDGYVLTRELYHQLERIANGIEANIKEGFVYITVHLRLG
jgi:hypothetical protein